MSELLDLQNRKQALIDLSIHRSSDLNQTIRHNLTKEEIREFKLINMKLKHMRESMVDVVEHTRGKEKVVTTYSDPGHGWAKVKRSELEKLGIADKISGYSYQRGEYVYLEEDSDLSTYVEALKARGIERRYVEHGGNKSSKIRNYQPYSYGGMHNG